MTSFSNPKFPFSLVFKICWNILCNFCADILEHSAFSYFIGRLNKKNNWEELFFSFTRPIKLEQSVPKRRYRKFTRRRIIQNKEHNIQNMAEV
jgi:hypothetical protein